MDVESRLLQCFAAAFPTLREDELRRASLASVAEWDSIASITVITLVEEEFQIEVPPDEIENMVSFELIADYLRAQEKSVA